MKKKTTREIARIRLFHSLEREVPKKKEAKPKARVIPGKGKRLSVIALATLAVLTQSCSGVITIASTEGLEAQGRAYAGMIEQGKATPDTKTAYWENENIIARKKSWLENVIHGGEK